MRAAYAAPSDSQKASRRYRDPRNFRLNDDIRRITGWLPIWLRRARADLYDRDGARLIVSRAR